MCIKLKGSGERSVPVRDILVFGVQRGKVCSRDSTASWNTRLSEEHFIVSQVNYDIRKNIYIFIYIFYYCWRLKRIEIET